MAAVSSPPPVVLFGYDSSAFTQKIRLALRLKQIPYTFVIVPSMMPRPVLREYFNLTYRKIPVLAIGPDVYCDTSLILEALEHVFTGAYPTLYPLASDGCDNRALIRGFQSYWTDRPLFRVTTGLMPGSVWRTSFGRDRAGLIGHTLDPDKLEAKLPRNLANLDLHLSLLEPQLAHGGWLFSTKRPSLADISLFYQLDWAKKTSAGQGIHSLTAGGTDDTYSPIMEEIFNPRRYPAVFLWFQRFQKFFDNLPSTETRVDTNEDEALEKLLAAASERRVPQLLPTPAPLNEELNEKIGLSIGAEVRVAPDDTGRDDPTHGTLAAISPEEIVIRPKMSSPAPKLVADLRLHFPRLGFVVQPFRQAKL